MYGRICRYILFDNEFLFRGQQVRIDTGAPEDNDQDQTREFMWKRSSNIAHLVAEKLTAVTRSMLQPPPQQIPAEPTPIPFAKAA